MTLPSLPELIRQNAESTVLTEHGHNQAIGLNAVASIAENLALPGWQVEAEAISMGVVPRRYLRNMESISLSMQKKLLQSRIAQLGLGGLGGNLLEIFLRTGIGRIRAADGDSFEETNLNRQALSSPETIGEPKALAAQRKGLLLNPSVDLDVREAYLTSETLPGFVKDSSVVVDALGGLQTRLALQHAASAAGIPLVTGALAGWSGYVAVVMPGDHGPAEIMGSNNSAEETLGCPSAAVTFFASLMAAETIKLLAEGSSPLAGHMLVVDLKNLSFDRISICPPLGVKP